MSVSSIHAMLRVNQPVQKSDVRASKPSTQHEASASDMREIFRIRPVLDLSVFKLYSNMMRRGSLKFLGAVSTRRAAASITGQHGD